MSQACGTQELFRIKSMLCYPLIPDKTPLAYIYAQQRHTLTKKQIHAIATALRAEPRYTKQSKDPFHAVLYARERFFVDPSTLANVPAQQDRRKKEEVVLHTCLSIAASCRNSRVLKLYISKMSHDLAYASQQCDADVERSERCLTV